MAVTLTINGTAFTFPQTGDAIWGDNVTNWATAVTSGMLQKAGGNFTLTADVNFGSSFGLLSKYFTTLSANAAASGVVRLANTDVVAFRNNANSGDNSLGCNTSDQVTWNGNPLLTTTGALSASRAVVTNGSSAITTSSVTSTQVGFLATAASNIHGDSDSATVTNKTFDSTSTMTGVRLASFTPDGTHTVTAPSATDTLVGKATTDTLTNKTISFSSNTITNLPGSSALKTPTIQPFSSTGTQTGWLFTVTSANATVGATYTNNANTYTVQGTISAGTLLFCSGTGATSGATLTKSGGTGDATITFSSKVATATYTTASSPAPLYLKVGLVGAGAGGAGSGTASGTAAAAGGLTAFGANLLIANGGGAASATTGVGGAGGAAGTVNSPALQVCNVAGAPGQASVRSAVTTVGCAGGIGGTAARFGGAGAGGADPTDGGSATGVAASANSGSGGGGGGGAGNAGGQQGGGGGGAGNYIEALIPSPSATYPYVVGAAGSAGGAGTSGAAGGAGSAGLILVEEIYQ